MKLFLAQIDLQKHEYMGESTSASVTRLVWATSAEEAEDKAARAFERSDPYGTSVDVVYVDVSEALT